MTESKPHGSKRLAELFRFWGERRTLRDNQGMPRRQRVNVQEGVAAIAKCERIEVRMVTEAPMFVRAHVRARFAHDTRDDAMTDARQAASEGGAHGRDTTASCQGGYALSPVHGPRDQRRAHSSEMGRRDGWEGAKTDSRPRCRRRSIACYHREMGQGINGGQTRCEREYEAKPGNEVEGRPEAWSREGPGTYEAMKDHYGLREGAELSKIVRPCARVAHLNSVSRSLRLGISPGIGFGFARITISCQSAYP